MTLSDDSLENALSNPGRMHLEGAEYVSHPLLFRPVHAIISGAVMMVHDKQFRASKTLRVSTIVHYLRAHERDLEGVTTAKVDAALATIDVYSDKDAKGCSSFVRKTLRRAGDKYMAAYAADWERFKKQPPELNRRALQAYSRHVLAESRKAARNGKK